MTSSTELAKTRPLESFGGWTGEHKCYEGQRVSGVEDGQKASRVLGELEASKVVGDKKPTELWSTRCLRGGGGFEALGVLEEEETSRFV